MCTEIEQRAFEAAHDRIGGWPIRGEFAPIYDVEQPARELGCLMALVAVHHGPS